MQIDFRPVAAKKKFSSEEVAESEILISDTHEKAKLKSHQCLQVGKYVVVKVDVEQDTIISIKKARVIKDVSEEFPENYRATIRKFKEDLNLTHEQIRELKQELRKVEIKEMELNDQLNYLETVAQNKKRDSDLNKIYNDFEKRSTAFNKCLNHNLLQLEGEMKADIRTALQNLNNVIYEYIKKL